jgi:phage terminase small subunit
MTANHPTRPRARPAIPVQAVGDAPEPPAHLSDEAAAQWRVIVSEWAIGADALPILRGALEMWDQGQAARRLVAAEGLVVTTGTGMVRQHPGAKIALDSFHAYRAGMKQLGLEPQGG